MAKDIFKNYTFLKALSENDGMSTRQVCEKVSCSYRNAYGHLRNLEAEGVVSSEMEGRQLIWKLNLENSYPCRYATSYNFSDVFSSLPLTNNTPVVLEVCPTLKNTLVKRVTKVGDGSIIRLFNKTPMPPKYGDDIICPHFLELKWANGCHFNCSWCYLQGTFRFLDRGKKAFVKDPVKIRDHLLSFFKKSPNPEILNAGEICDSLLDSSIFFIARLFEQQSKHKLLLVTKSAKIAHILKLNSHSQIVVSFSANSEKVATRWEKGAPSPSIRLDAAQLLYESGFPIRLRIDPILPYPNRWETDYKDLIDDIFRRFEPERITFGSLRGLRSTINHCKDDSWVEYLKENSKWGLRPSSATRLNLYSTLLDYLNSEYGYNNVALCKETKDMWHSLKYYGMDYKEIKCNCTW